jgi:hypothetical protein
VRVLIRGHARRSRREGDGDGDGDDDDGSGYIMRARSRRQVYPRSEQCSWDDRRRHPKRTGPTEFKNINKLAKNQESIHRAQSAWA